MIWSGSLSLTNCTVAENSAFRAAAFWTQGGSPIEFVHTTISANTALNTLTTFNPTRIENSIIAGNFPDSSLSGPITLVGANLTSGAPRLAPLGNYGGPNQTMLPLPLSPALNQIIEPEVSIDQRGVFRQIQGDIGAVELLPAIDLHPIWNTDFDDDGYNLGTEIAAGSNPVSQDSADIFCLNSLDANGDALLTFGWDPDNALFVTNWIISFSPDLVEDFVPIFSYNGDFVTLGLEANTSFDLTNGTITYKDADAPAAKGFYRFEAEYAPFPGS